MKKILILSIVLLFIFGITTMVIATDLPSTLPESTPQIPKATLVAKAYLDKEGSIPIEGDEKDIAPGEKIYVKLSLEGIQPPTTTINKIYTKIGYNTTIFNMIDQNDISSDMFTTIYNDSNEKHELTLTSGESVIGSQKIELATITFETKSGLKSQDTQISFEKSEVSDGQNKNVSLNPITVVNLKIGTEIITTQPLDHIEISKKPTKIAYKPGEKFDPKGMEVTAVYSDNTKMKVTDYTYAPKGETKDRELKLTDKIITISYMDKKVNVEISVNEEGKMPQTGITDHPFIALSILAIAVISFIGIRKYRNI